MARDKFGEQIRVEQRLLLVIVMVFFALIAAMAYDESAGLNYSFWVIFCVSAVLVAIFMRQIRSMVRLANRLDKSERLLEQERLERATLQETLDAHLSADKGVEAKGGEREEQIQRLLEQLDLVTVKERSRRYFELLAEQFELVQGLLFQEDGSGEYTLRDSYAYYSDGKALEPFHVGETLTGQVVREGKSLYLSDIPKEYAIIVSGLGRSAPSHLIIIPLSASGDDRFSGVVELAFFRSLSQQELQVIEGFTRSFGEELLSANRVEEAKL